MKTPKAQPVTFDCRNYETTAINEAQTKFYPLYSIVIYDAGETIATLGEYELSRKMGRYGSFTTNLPIVWNARKEHDPAETRAHFVTETNGMRRRYVLYIPAEAVTVESVHDRASKGTGYTERSYTVKDFPARFTKSYRHPFNHYAAQEAAKQLAKDYYSILTPETINTPDAQERLKQFWKTVQDFSAEAERVKNMSDAEFIAESLEAAHIAKEA